MSLKHFKPSEFVCSCGKCGLEFSNMDPELLEKLDRAREIAGVPFKINSSIRCKEHNKKVGGAANSNHLYGVAVDVSCVDSATRMKIVRALIAVGFNRIGIAKTFVHADVGSQTNKGIALWLY